MAKEDYTIEINGTLTNVSKLAKQNKIKYGNIKFNKLKERFDIEVIENNNNIINFKIFGNEYYYGLVSSKIRRKGEREWTGKLIKTLQHDIDEMYKNIEYE